MKQSVAEGMNPTVNTFGYDRTKVTGCLRTAQGVFNTKHHEAVSSSATKLNETVQLFKLLALLV